MEIRCSYCGGTISGAVHVEPEGFYHPECFLKTPRAAKLAALRDIEDAIRQDVAQALENMVSMVRSRFDGAIRAHGITDEEIANLVVRAVLRAWRRSG